VDMKKVSDAHSVPRQVSTYIGTPTDINFSLPKISSWGVIAALQSHFMDCCQPVYFPMASPFPRNLFLTIFFSEWPTRFGQVHAKDGMVLEVKIKLVNRKLPLLRSQDRAIPNPAKWGSPYIPRYYRRKKWTCRSCSAWRRALSEAAGPGWR
jgi:hypothetical protein